MWNYEKKVTHATVAISSSVTVQVVIKPKIKERVLRFLGEIYQPPKLPPELTPNPPHVVVDQPPKVKQLPPQPQPPKPHANASWVADPAANITIVTATAMMLNIAFVCIVI